MVLLLIAVWLITIGVITYRVQTLGAFATRSMSDTLEYTSSISQARPGNVRLTQPYSQWAFALDFTDPANYIKTGLGFADGKGVTFKNIDPKNPAQVSYIPYYYQSPGVPVAIGTVIKIFGTQSILPYFIIVLVVHFATALLTCVLASLFFKDDRYILGAGLLSLLCLPVVDFDFGFGLFASEPLAAPCVGIALISISIFWKKLEVGSCSRNLVILTAVGFGGALAIAAYCRDVYTTFAQFCFLILLLVALLDRSKFKQVTAFVLISAITLCAVEHPWRMRNKRYFGEYAMSGSTYYGYTMWYDMWDSYKERAKWGGDGGIGFGNYLAPEKSPEVMAQINSDKKKGSSFALRTLLNAIWQRPLDALGFKLRVFDRLWFGRACCPDLYLWGVFSAATFVIFLFLTRFRFVPGLWLFPMFLICVSPLIDFQMRFSQPFFLFVTPVTAMYVLNYLRKNVHAVKPSSARDVSMIEASEAALR